MPLVSDCMPEVLAIKIRRSVPGAVTGRKATRRSRNPNQFLEPQQKQAGWGEAAQSGPRQQAGARRAIGAARYFQGVLCAMEAGMTGGGCAVLAWRRGGRRPGQGHVRQTQDAGGVRCGRPQAWRGRCACLFGGTVPGTPAGAAIPGFVFRAAALAFRRAAGRQMSTHGRIS